MITAQQSHFQRYERIKEVKTGNKVLELPTINTLPIDVLIIPKSLLI